MRKLFLFITCFCLLVSCSDANNPDENPDSAVSESDVSETSFSDISATESVENQSHRDTALSLSEYMNNSSLNIIDIYGIGEKEYLLTVYDGEKYSIQVLNTENGEISDSVVSDTAPVCSENGFWVLKTADNDEKAMTFYYDGSAGFKFDTLYTYDFYLTKTNEIDLSGKGRVSGFEVDLSHNKIFYSYNAMQDGNESHYLDEMDFNGNVNPVMEIKYTFDHDNWLSALYEMKCISDKILFLGTVFPFSDGSTSSVAGFGTLDINNPVPDYTYRNDSYNYKMEKFSSGAIVHDARMPVGVEPSGFVEYFKDGQQKEIQLQNPFETSEINVSQNGEYFTTKLYGQNEDGSTIYRLTVYDSDGNVVKENDYSFENSGTIPKVFTDEYSKTVFFETMGSGTQWHEFSF